MKRIIKQTVLVIALFFATSSFSNVVDSVSKNSENSSIITIDHLKLGSLIKIKDADGIIIHKEEIKKSDIFAKSYNLSQLPNATYYLELESQEEISILPVRVQNQYVQTLNEETTIIAKPIVTTEGKMVHIQQNSNKAKDIVITIYYNGEEVAYREALKNAISLRKNYDFTGSLSGEYTIVVSSDGRSFSNKINIP